VVSRQTACSWFKKFKEAVTYGYCEVGTHKLSWPAVQLFTETVKRRAQAKQAMIMRECQDLVSHLEQITKRMPTRIIPDRRTVKNIMVSQKIHGLVVDDKSATRQNHDKLGVVVDFFERLAAACNATLDRSALTIQFDPATLLLAELMMNGDETVIDFTETRGVRVYGGRDMRRLERRVVRFRGNHVSWTPIVTAANDVMASLLVFKHSSPTKVREAIQAEADALAAAVATFEG